MWIKRRGEREGKGIPNDFFEFIQMLFYKILKDSLTFFHNKIAKHKTFNDFHQVTSFMLYCFCGLV